MWHDDLAGLLAMLMGGVLGGGLGAWAYLWMRDRIRLRPVANPYTQRPMPPQSPSKPRTAPREPMGM